MTLQELVEKITDEATPKKCKACYNVVACPYANNTKIIDDEYCKHAIGKKTTTWKTV
jgi:hypothetical protein